MTRLATLAVVAILVVAPAAPAARADERAAQDAMKHYRAGTEALAHELYDQAEQEFRSAIAARPAPRRARTTASARR